MKRKSYEDKVMDLIYKAKAETIALMKERGIREMEIHGVHTIAENEEGQLQVYPVKKVAIANYIGEDVLEWDYDGPSAWHNNPLLWIHIHRAVFYALGEYTKRFLGI